ncbi:UNVERIFIED_ORG: hypothetical protein DFS12_101134 [Chitinophaga ginsengisegetis]
MFSIVLISAFETISFSKINIGRRFTDNLVSDIKYAFKVT